MKKGPVYGKGLQKGVSATKAEWMQWCAAALLSYLEERYAAPRVEVNHYLYEKGRAVDGKILQFDPHIITPTVNDLIRLGVLEAVPWTTSGGGTVDIIVRTDLPRRQTATQQAIRRKALLYRRLTAIIHTAGEAGERVLRHSLTNAGDHLTPVLKGYAETPHLLGVSLRGPIDSAAHMIAYRDDMPRVIVVPIELKNRRLVLYPTHEEVHQLLQKAAHVQITQPTADILPILVCRRAHPYLFWMARDLGFLVHTMGRQYVTIPKSLDRRKFDEVTRELGLDDLYLPTTDDGRPRVIGQFFSKTIRNYGPPQLPRWKISADAAMSHFEQLRFKLTDPADRPAAVQELHRITREKLTTAGLEFGGGWALPDLDDEEPDPTDDAVDAYEDEL